MTSDPQKQLYVSQIGAHGPELVSTLGKFAPFSLDLEKKWLKHRKYFQKVSLKKDLMLKALGVTTWPKPVRIIDLTCGWGDDALFMLLAGARVISFERHGAVYNFLKESYSFALAHTKVVGFAELLRRWDIRLGTFNPGALKEELVSDFYFYYDPMYPDGDKKRRALPDKSMQILHDLVGEDVDQEAFLKQVVQLQPKRLVVKRPKKLPPLLDIACTFQVQGESTRFDVYCRP